MPAQWRPSPSGVPSACRDSNPPPAEWAAAAVLLRRLGAAAVFLGWRPPLKPGLGKLTFPEFAPALQQLQAAARTDARAAAAASRAQQSAFGPHTEEEDTDGLDVDGGDFGGDGGAHPAD